MLLEVPLWVEVEAASVVVAPVNSPDMAAVINRNFIVALVIGMSFRKRVWVDGWLR